MPKLPIPRTGDAPEELKVLKIKNKVVEFSLWPTRRSTRRAGLSSRVYVSDPWPLLEGFISQNCQRASRPTALSFLHQSSDYYCAAYATNIKAARPVHLYYSFLNLSKAAILTRKISLSLDTAQHGLSENSSAAAASVSSIRLTGYPSTASTTNVFDELMMFLSGSRLTRDRMFMLEHLIPQVVTGHRLWASAADAFDRFIPISRIRLLEDETSRSIWVVAHVDLGDLTRSGLNRKKLLDRGRLSASWEAIRAEDAAFQQRQVITYESRAADRLQDLIDSVKPFLWQGPPMSPPYRRYYFYAAPNAEHSSVIPQLAAIYALSFVLGSLTRYRPAKYCELVESRFGAFFEAFLQDAPKQFLYLIASELMKREVAYGDQV